ncbi:hemagglutinin repeat-containing protein [Pseudomonas mosselii]|uniref:hemagglutinin repeat-containing protein n=1 Tax=Pseudomonas mosselii TaxID=78327 RepID=UPI0021DB59C4|nr:hemagglutinin repeat-containing protein [Pseudomonas mosselii]MCU9532223.1 hemagglutinin repeat-containing protein [Pseudomonas mosselii]MCU9539528.1 hemagglutinin repeat-containing protein [Pseudomonas mosselii]MCU9545191.1 hemagglutinin repeat-containing protein [Pseudomonas mosselii]
MDVRLFAFLARQRSAEIQPREHFCGLPKRGLAFLLANAMFWQPLWAQAAEGVVVSGPGTSLGQAGNGVPIVNIAAPNGSGLSHNQFSDYNVGQQGLILNNATDRTQATQLGGIILGNPNLQGAAANVILNEVNGANASQLRGYTEVAGRGAHVIVANPHGITCDGCGFINTPQATLSTGKPVIENGQLTRYQVDQGHIAIEGAGINASNVDSFELIARSTKINAEIQARNLAIVAGRNDVDVRTLAATARADDGSAKPSLAIDSSALGGMYAGAVRLVGTEAGVGVRLDGRMIASGGDIQLDANGQLRMAQASATGDVRLQAQTIDAQGPVHAGKQLQLDSRGELVNRQGLTAAGSVQLDAAGKLSNLGGIQAGIDAAGNRVADADLNVNAGAVDNRNQRLIASGDLTLSTGGRLDNQGGSVSAGRHVDINAATLDNRQQGKVLADGHMTLTGGQLLNSDRGQITSQGALNATWAHLDNQAGELSSLDALALNLGSLDNRNGKVLANRGITLTSQVVSGAVIDNQHGEIASAGDSHLRAASLDNRGGRLSADQALTLTVDQALDNRQGVLASGKALTLNAASLDNREQGKLLSDDALTVTVSGMLDNQDKGLLSGVGATRIEAGQLDNRGGRLVGKDLLTLHGQHWDNRGGKIEGDGAMTLTLDQLDNRDQGLVSGQAGVRFNGTELLNQLGILGAKGNLDLVAAHLDNSGGSLTSGGDLNGQVTRLEQLGGKLSADGKLTLKGSSLVNRQGAVLGAGQGMRLTVDNVDNRGGELSAAKALSLTGQRLDNTGGQVLAETDLSLTVAEVINQAQGLLRGKGQLILGGQTLDNRDGRVSGEQGARLRLGQALDNGKGLLTSEGDLDIGAASLDNTDAELSSAGKLTLATTGKVDNQRGSITADGTLDLRSASLDNRAGEIGAQGAVDIATGALDNRDSGHVVGNDRLTIKAGQVNNAGADSRIDSDGAMSLTATGFDQQAGRLLSKASITLDLGQGALVNHGLIKAPLLVLNNLGSVDNQKGEITSPQGFTLAADTLDNRQGKLLSDQVLTVRIAQALDNAKGLVSAKGLDLRAASLDNREGEVSSRAGLALTIDDRLDNRQGTLVSDTSLKLYAKTLDNSKGKISGKGRGEIEAATLVNTAGSLVSLEQLQVKGGELDNREAGLLGSNGTLTLEVDRIDNRGGEITGKAAVGVTGTSLDNSDGGLLVAGTGMTLALQGLLNRNKARIEAQTGLTLTGLTLDNDGGRLTSQRDMTLTLTGAALNRLGLISAEGQLLMAAQSLDNSTGKLDSAGSLKLTTTGALLNKAGELLSDSDITLDSASLDNAAKGVIASKGALAITTGHLDNSRQGSVSSNRTLDLHAGQLDNRDGGRVGSREALSATVTGLDQQGGKLFSDTSVNLDLSHGHLDNRGGLINAPSLLLNNLKSVANQGGEISSAQAFTVAAEQLDNGNGRLLSDQRLLLQISQRLDNLKGLIGGQSLEVNAGVLSNRDGGRIEAKDALTLTSKGLDNHGGKLLGSSLALDLLGADLDNGAGLITTAGPLTLANLAKLSNQGGEISTAQALRLDISELDNRDGKLISEQTLAITSGAIDNRNGLVSGWQGLTVNGQSLDNRQQGTLSSRSGAVQVTVAGALRNSDGGALVAQQRLDVKADSLDNSANGILSSGSGQQLTITGALDNHEGGLIDAGEKLVISAGSLDNHGGRVATRQDLGLTAASLNNTDGNLAAQGALTLDLLGDLLNRKGTLFAGKDLLIQRAGLVDNRAGQIASQGLLKVLAGSIDNSQRGTLAANGALVLNSSGALSNMGDGLIYSQQGDVSLQAASLNNAKGTVQAKGAITAQANAVLDNQGGKLIAQEGALTVTADTLDNRGGILASLKQSLGVRTTGVLRNGSDANGQRGVLQALGIDVQSANLDNHGGRIAALGSDALIRTGQLDNRDGGISASGLLKVIGTSLLNGGNARGEMVGQRIDIGLSGALDNLGGIVESVSTFAITAASLDNQAGKLRALGNSGTTRFQIGGVLDNRNGTVETANTDLALVIGDLVNTGGSIVHVGNGDFGVSSQQVMAAGGRLLTHGTLDLSADSWVNSSVLQAGTLNLNVNNFSQTSSGQLLATKALLGTGGNWLNDGLIASDGTLNLTLGGAYSGNGRLTSLGNMTLTAAQMSLGTATSIAGGDSIVVNIGNQLSNLGRLSAANDLTINAGSLSNYGALAASRNLNLIAQSVHNDQAADASRGLLFSGRDMTISTADFSNRYADVYSLGNLLVAGVTAGSSATTFLNSSGTVEAAGDINLQASSFVNKRDKFRASHQITDGYMTIYCVQHCKGSRVRGPVHIYKTQETVVLEDSPTATLAAGRNLTIGGDSVVNSRSVISAGNDLTITAGSITNEGERSRSGTVGREVGAGIKIPRAYFFQLINEVNAYNQAHPRSGPFDEAAFNKLVAKFDPGVFYGIDAEPVVQPDQKFIAPAVIQAAGTAKLTAAGSISNIVVNRAAAATSNRSFDTQVSSVTQPTVVNLNAQLPPDLAQRQVDPTTLPGFSLPAGQNGLFRLSGKDSDTATGTPQRWTLGNATVTSHEREVLASSRPGSIQAMDASVSRGSEQAIDRVAHQRVESAAKASVIGVNAPAGEAVDSYVPPPSAGALAAELVAQVPGIGARPWIAGVTRLPDSQYTSKPHKYLIETNPVLTDLKQFMSSDYLLGNLGFDPDKSWKRLGDGFYEQRLIQQAVVARTGQQFIDGQTSGEQLYKHLMDNAIRSKDQLNLSLGVGLTSAQVAALTHDIVWLEAREINGEQVLAPVLYLAHANGRLAPDGALIAGQDVQLIAGENLDNVGTLRASRNLSATAGKDLTNTGLVQAGERLDLLAGNSLVNSAGGIVSGRDVSLTAINGDLINRRDLTRTDIVYGGVREQKDYLESAARIEAGNSLSLKAGQDIKNVASVIQSGGDLSLSAGRDVSLLSVEERQGFYTDRQRSSTVQQHGATVSAGRDLSLGAGRDLTAVASQIDAGRNLTLAAGEDLNLTSAANEAHSFSRSKKVTQSNDQVTQVSTTVKAGGDVSLSAGQDMAIVASQVKGKGAVDIDAERDLTIASEQNESASYYLKKSKGSFGRGSSKQQESYHSTNVASVIEAGGDLTVNVSKKDDGGIALDGGRDVSVIGSQLKAGGDVMLGATGDVAVLSGVEEHGEYSKKTKSGFLGLSKSGKSQLQTHATQVGSELDAGNDIVIAAGSDVRLRASEANAGKDVELRAGLIDKEGDVNLVSANDTAYSHSDSYKKKIGMSVSPGIVVIPSVSLASAKKAGQEARSSTSVGSQVLAVRDASLQAERDINLLGSGVNAGRNVSLNAGRDVNVAAAENQSDSKTWSKTSKVGLTTSADDNGIKVFVGVEKEVAKDRLREQLASSSQIKAGQDLDVNAGRDINQTGSDLIAGHDISLGAGRDINIDAARETRIHEQEREYATQGAGASINHNFGRTKDAVSNAGKGENGVSKVASTLQAIDGINQFLAGPTGDLKIGNSSQKNQQTSIEQSNRGSSLEAGHDIKLQAGNDVNVKGSQVQAGRDIDVKGRDINIDVAHGSSTQKTRESQNWAGVHGGTSGGIKVGIGASHGAAGVNGTQGNSTPTQLDAGRDIKLDASHDLNIVGSQVKAGRDIDLTAGNDLNIRAAQNDSHYEQNRRSGGGEVGLAFGSEGVGIYASVNLGKGALERDAQRHQEAYVYAGDQLKFSSGKDTNVQGAQVRGDEVIGRVGGDLNVASAIDTGKVKGKEFDLSATVTVGPGSGISGSVGKGKTRGETEWVENQTRITARDKVDIRSENHTQLDGALIAADNGNLKLDTGTLGHSDIAGKDQESGYYLNVGGTWKKGNAATQQDSSQTGKGDKGENGWSVSGWKYEKDREQIVRATVGAGDITVRKDAETGKDSTVGLNRDLDKAYEITRDHESRTDLYATGSSTHAVMNPVQTLQQWKDSAAKYGENSEEALNKLGDVFLATAALAVGTNPDSVNFGLATREIYRQLGSRYEQTRSNVVRSLLGRIAGNQNSEAFDIVAQRLTEVAGEDPARVAKILNDMAKLNGQKPGQQNFVPVAYAGYVLMGALATALGVSQLAPERQAEMQAAVSSAIDSIEANVSDYNQRARIVRLMVEVVLEEQGLPIHVLDPRLKQYEGSRIEGEGRNPSSGGYGEGGQVVTTPHTGGKQLDGQSGSGTYVTPEHQQNPGLVFNENTGYDFKPADRSGIKFDTSIVNKPNGALEIELSARQKFDKNGVVVDSKFAHTDLVARFAPETGLFIDWYGTTVKGRNIGTELISRAIEEVGPTRVKQVSATLGNDNREAYQTARDAGLPADQAVWGTPLGKTMSSLGFKNVEVTSSYSVKFRY